MQEWQITQGRHGLRARFVAQGLGFIHSISMEASTEFILYLPPDGGSSAKAVLCSVIRWQPLDEKIYAIGARFVREVPCPAPGSLRGNTRNPACIASDAAEPLSAQEKARLREVEARLARLPSV